MTYVKQTWNNLDVLTPISAARLNYMETGIFNAAADPTGFTINANSSSIVNSFTNSGTGTVLNVLGSDTAVGAQAAFLKTYAGSGTAHVHALTAYCTGDGNAFASAGNFVSDNSAASCIQVSGVESGRGTIKVAHVGTGADGNASALSINLAGTGTDAQGIFIDATDGGTTGKLIQIRNNGNAIVSIYDSGKTRPIIQLKAGPIISCGTGTPEGAITASVGSLWMRTDGGAGTSLYVKESGAGNTGWVGK